jgi:CBS-domain-containing membrane protein
MTLATLKTVRVRDVMTNDVTTLASTDSIDFAARVLSERHITGAPVVRGEHIVGVVSKTDLCDPRRADSTTVESVMTRIVYAVRPTDPIMSAVRLMVEESIHRVVVVTDTGKLIGIVTAMDIVKAIARGDQVQEVFVDAGGADRHADPAGVIDFVDLRSFSLR